jgi:hypothetical protein
MHNFIGNRIVFDFFSIGSSALGIGCDKINKNSIGRDKNWNLKKFCLGFFEKADFGRISKSKNPVIGCAGAFGNVCRRWFIYFIASDSGFISMFPDVVERWDKKNSVLNVTNKHNTFINQH